MIADDPKLQQEFWSQSVMADAEDLNPLKDFVGGEGSGKPFVEKRDANVNGGQKVYFTTRAPVRGRGVIGSAELKSKTSRLKYGTFGVTVDLRRFAISEEQLVQYFTLPGNAEKNRDEVLMDLSAQWWARTKCDDIQMVLRQKALFATDQPNVLRVGSGASRDALTPDDTYDTGTITDGKNALIGFGGQPLAVDKSVAGADVPQYLVFAPSRVLEGLEDEQKFREAVHNNQARGGEAYWWTGKYPVWKNQMIFNHNLVIDSGPNRLGSPLLPFALLGAAIAAGTAAVDITGGGTHNDDASLTDTVLYDFFSYFPGYYWKTYETESAPTDNNTYHVLVFNVSGADKGKYEIFSYAAASNNGNKLANCTRAVEKAALVTATKFTEEHPTGSWIIPCNNKGVPIGWALHLGAEALFIGKGALEADPIEWGDDFKSKTTGRAHINAQGIQSMIGYSPFEDTIGRYSNYFLIECAVDYPELNLADITA
ncbi:MAG TPA: DUF4043 family protein [Candidatus Synoicihabitans sp.]|nr:DUF4043 family protein [Candidatus Synoicihabitans sp.]